MNQEVTLNDLALNYRAARVLDRAGIDSIEKLCQKSAFDLSRLQNCGIRTVRIIEAALLEKGLKLAPSSNPVWALFTPEVCRRHSPEYIERRLRLAKAQYAYWIEEARKL